MTPTPTGRPIAPSPPSEGGTGVLVASASACTRDLLAGFMATRGFAVWTAEDGVRALDAYVRNLGGIEAVVADAALPDLPGVAFVGRFRRHFPGVPVLVLTDDPFGQQAAEFADLGVTLVAKPVHLRQLLDTLRAVLAAPAVS